MTKHFTAIWMLAATATFALAACQDDQGSIGGPYPAPTPTPTMTPTPTPAVPSFTAKSLVSNVSGLAPVQDTNLSHAWGIAFGPGAVWVAAHGSNKSTLYDGNGVVQSLVVDIPAAANGAPSGPTGIVANGNPAFTVSKAGASGTAAFRFAGTGGTISGWSPNADRTNAITVFDGSTQGDAFTGLAVYSQGGTNLLLAANFSAGRVDAFDASYKKVTLPGGFRDTNLPAGYVPFGIQTVGTQIYVTFAHVTPSTTPKPEDHGPGLGRVDVFDATGTLVRRLDTTGDVLNAPWGIAQAPANFGAFGNAILVGNFGDGRINAYDSATGKLLGTLMSAGSPLTIPGLWGIAFGNDALNQPRNTLFYGAGPTDSGGVYGRIDTATTP